MMDYIAEMLNPIRIMAPQKTNKELFIGLNGNIKILGCNSILKETIKMSVMRFLCFSAGICFQL